MARRRSILKKFALAAGAVVLVGVACLAALWVLGGGKPTISVDYAAKLNERAAAVPEEDRAWPLYWEAIRTLHEDRYDPEFNRLVYEAEPGTDDWAKVVTLFDERKEAIATLHRAAKMPGMGLVVTVELANEFADSIGEGRPFTVPASDWGVTAASGDIVPFFTHFRHVARMLNADARVAIDTGEPGRFVNDVGAIVGLSEHVNEHPMVITDLTAIAIRVMAYARVKAAIADYPGTLGPEHLERLNVVLREADGGGGFRDSFEGERWLFLDSVQRLYTDDGHGDGRLAGNASALDQGGGPGPSAWDRVAAGFMGLFVMSRAELVAEYDRRLGAQRAWAEIPLWERGSAAEYVGFEEHEPAEMMMVSLDQALLATFEILWKVQVAAASSDFQKDATRVVIALERARLETGSWPSSLDELVPDYLDRVPIDPFSGEPLLYTHTDTGIVLHSVGMDGDDDGGRAVSYARNWAAPDKVAGLIATEPEKYDGDLVFFPPPEFD